MSRDRSRRAIRQALDRLGLRRPLNHVRFSLTRPPWWREQRARRCFFRRLIPRRSLCFDVGANDGFRWGRHLVDDPGRKSALERTRPTGRPDHTLREATLLRRRRHGTSEESEPEDRESPERGRSAHACPPLAPRTSEMALISRSFSSGRPIEMRTCSVKPKPAIGRTITPRSRSPS